MKILIDSIDPFKKLQFTISCPGESCLDFLDFRLSFPVLSEQSFSLFNFFNVFGLEHRT